MDSQVVDAIKGAGKPFVPIVGADLRAFVEQLLNVSGDYEGLTGIAVYNPAAVGGAGVKLALQLLNGETVETGENNTVLLPAPEAWDNVSEEGKAKLAEINEPKHRPAVSGQLVHRRLDRLHPGRDVGLQGSGRVDPPRDPQSDWRGRPRPLQSIRSITRLTRA